MYNLIEYIPFINVSKRIKCLLVLICQKKPRIFKGCTFVFHLSLVSPYFTINFFLFTCPPFPQQMLTGLDVWLHPSCSIFYFSITNYYFFCYKPVFKALLMKQSPSFMPKVVKHRQCVAEKFLPNPN